MKTWSVLSGMAQTPIFIFADKLKGVIPFDLQIKIYQ
jgi:hypothetical protein